MKNRYRIYVRGKYSGGKIWWIQDNQTNQRESLHTTDKSEAKRLLELKNAPHHFTGYHVQMCGMMKTCGLSVPARVFKCASNSL